MKRKDFLKLMSAGTGVLAFSPGMFSCQIEENAIEAAGFLYGA